MSKNLTPEHMRCTIGASCHSIHKLEDGRLFIIGEYANSKEWAQAGDPKKSDSEAAIVISPDLLSEYVNEKVKEELKNLKVPNSVHIGMLRGDIAKISMMQCAHTHGQDAVAGLVQTPSPQADPSSGHPVASDGGEAVFGWLPHYADPLDVLTWKLSEAFGATISERQWLAARELLTQFEPSPQAESLSGHQDFEAKARELWKRVVGSDVRGDMAMPLIASALSSAVAEEREACAKVADDLAVELASFGDAPSSIRAEMFTVMRVGGRIRSRSFQVTAPLPQGQFEPEAPRKPVQPVS